MLALELELVSVHNSNQIHSLLWEAWAAWVAWAEWEDSEE